MKKRGAILWASHKVRRRLPMLAGLVAANAGSALLSVLFALGSRMVIDSAVQGERSAFLRACGLQLAIIVGILICVTVQRYLSDRLNTELDRDWKTRLLHGLLRGDYAKVSTYHSGELINRLNNDVRTLNDGMISAVPGAVSMVVRLGAAIVVVAAMEPVFAMAVVFIGLAALVGTGIIRRRLKEYHKRVSETDGRVLGFLQETLEKLLVVQAMDLGREAEKRADVLLDERYQMQRRKRRMSLTANTGVSVLYYLAGFVTLVWCAREMLHGRMTFGTLTAMIQLVNQLQAPFVNLSGILPKYIAMTAAAERLRELEEIQPASCEELDDPKEYYDRMESLCAENMSFSYEEESVFQNASFALPKGAFAAVTGASGIGKSTLLKLMLGIFSPEMGELFALDRDHERLPLSRGTRGLFAYVPQGLFLFSGTLRENLLISRPEASEEEIAKAVYASGMDLFLSQLADGLNTVIGENGAGLSEGQAQRLAIGRAVLSGAPILLLDEITSALDGETEEIVLRRIAEMDGRTCIVVTHRPAALQMANWRLEVSDGGIRVKTTWNVEAGQTAKLLKIREKERES